VNNGKWRLASGEKVLSLFGWYAMVLHAYKWCYGVAAWILCWTVLPAPSQAAAVFAAAVSALDSVAHLECMHQTPTATWFTPCQEHGSSTTLAYAGVQTYCETSFTPYGGSNFERIQVNNVVGYIYVQKQTRKSFSWSLLKKLAHVAMVSGPKEISHVEVEHLTWLAVLVVVGSPRPLNTNPCMLW